jgi:hypothetical protein
LAPWPAELDRYFARVILPPSTIQIVSLSVPTAIGTRYISCRKTWVSIGVGETMWVTNSAATLAPLALGTWARSIVRQLADRASTRLTVRPSALIENR